MAAPDLVIFDCDGVLVDSEIIAARVEAEILTGAGYAIDPETMAERFSGLNFEEIIRAVELDADVPLQASLIDKAEKAVNDRLARDVTAIEGAVRAVSGMPKRCICSNSSPERLSLMLERTGLEPLFKDTVFSVADTATKKPKPAPDVFLHAAGRMEADPANSFVIEDSVHGIAGAVAAGMRVIGFTGGAHSYPGHADRLTDAGAETVINRWSGFLPVLLALTEWQDV